MKVANYNSLILRIIVAAFLLAGCTPELVKQRYFWPPPPDPPRIEWMGRYQTEYDLEKPSFFEQYITGLEEVERLSSPLYVGADGKGRFYVSDNKIAGVMVFDMNSKKAHILGGANLRGMLARPTGIAIDQMGNIYVADSESRKIYMLDTNEKVVKYFDLSKECKAIGSIAIDKTRMRLIVPTLLGNKVLIFDLVRGNVYKVLGGERGIADGEFNAPTAAAVTKDGTILICDSFNARVQIFSPEGEFRSKIGRRGDAVGELVIIKGVAVDSEDHIYVTDAKSNQITIFSMQGDILLVFGKAFSTTEMLFMPGGFLNPNGIYVDQNDTIYIADQMNRQVQIFQYLNDKYMKEHPITKETPIAQPVKAEKEEAK